MPVKIDTRDLKRLMARLKDMPTFQYGIHSDHAPWQNLTGREGHGQMYEEDPVDVAIRNEEGDAQQGLPPRPFISDTAEILAQEYPEKMADYLRTLNRNLDVRAPASKWAQDMQRRGLQILWTNEIGMEDNSDVTIEIKGENSPMIDGGELINLLDVKEKK